MQLKNQRFFMWFNRFVFPFFYLPHQGKQTTVVRTRDGAQFTVRINTSDILVIWEIWKAKVYDDPRFPILPNDIVVDIGAHIGGFAVRAAKQARRVYAYEASKTNYDLLETNRRLNDLGNLHIHNKAVSHISGEMKFFMPGGNGALGSLLQEIGSPMEIVQTTTLANIIEDNRLDRIDFLKVDVEGAEYDILSHCPPAALSIVRRIVMEYHEFDGHRRGHRELAAVLRSNGFNVAVEGGVFPQKFLFGTGIIKAWRD